MITQDQYNVCKQTIRNQSIKIDLLNFQMQTVDELSGNCISGSINIDANADIRRTCDITLVVQDSSFDIQSGSKIWLDKYAKVNLGIESTKTGENIWFNYGVFMIDAPSWKFDAVTNTFSFQGLDLTAKLTGLRNGYLEGIPAQIPSGSNVRETLISTITQLGGFNNYIIEECRLADGTIQPTPYDITIDQGGTVWDIIVALRDILSNYEAFFNENGIFVYQPIPTGENEAPIADDDIITQNLISEDINTDFSSVKNVIEVYGHSKEPAHYSSSTTVSNNVYQLSIAEVTAYEDSVLYGFTAPSIISSPSLKIGNLSSLPIVLSNGSAAIIPEADAYYIVQYQEVSNNFLFLGHQQSIGYAEDVNDESPFYVNGSVGKIRAVFFGGEYDNILSDELAVERANYELWLHTRLQDSVTLSCVPIHFLDVNQLISHGIKNNQTQLPYIIKSISVDLSESGTQSINTIRYYPLYPAI